MHAEPPSPSADTLSLTGERTLPGLAHENYWFRRHEAAYDWAATVVAPHGRPEAMLVDAGSGEGYGADRLAGTTSARVVAVDYDATATAHTRRRYPGLGAVRANLVSWPLAGGCADAVVCLQVVEHVWSVPELLAETARVLHPGGLLVLSTPNRLTFSPGLGRGQRPANPFHVRELDAEELAEEVSDRLEVRTLHGLSHGPRLREWEERHGSLVAAQLAGPPELWSADLASTVAGVTSADFVVGDADDDCLDLLLVARR